MNPWDLIGPAFQIAAAIAGALTETLSPGEQIAITPIRCYIGKVHLEIDLMLKTIPPP